MSDRFDREYDEYLARASQELGQIAVGKYSKFQGQLVKKLSRDEFGERWAHYLAVRRAYDEVLQHGDTVNDALVHLLSEHAALLLLKI